MVDGDYKSRCVLLWLGEQRNPVQRERKHDLVMDTVINYYHSISPRLAYEPGRLFLDNGAYTAARHGQELERDRVIEVQERINPDQTIPLDYPFRVGISTLAMRRLWEKTAENILYWQESTSLGNRLVPTLHAWSTSSLLNNVRWLQKHVNSDFLALGSLVGSDFSEFNGFFGDRQPRPALVDMLCQAVDFVEDSSDFRIHIMGFGSSPLMLHLAYYLGAYSTDSTGFRRKAAFGKIILPGTGGERYVGNSSASFGMSQMSSDNIESLRNCLCEVCRLNQDALWSHWKARAIHNEYVLKLEALRAHILLSQGLENYEKYLDGVFSRSSLRYLWDYAKLKRKYHRISQVLFRK